MAHSRFLTDQDVLNSPNQGKQYPNPFFDLASNYIPKNIKVLFRYCRNFFYTNSFLRNVVSKLTEYPITEILYGAETDEKTKKKYNTILHKKLRIKSFLIEIGLDYHTYGNAFISSFLKPKRFLKFSFDEQLYPIEKMNFRMRNFKILAKHPKTGEEHEVKIEDEYVKSIDNFRLIRWAPENIEIESNPVTGNTRYFYKIPNKVKKKIIVGDKTTLKEIPKVFLEALQQKKSIEIDKNNFYHFKQPTLAEEDMSWGKPLILPALKDIFYLQTLKRGNEAIAMEHITPKKSISPAASQGVDPFSQLNMGKWTNKMEEQIKKWRRDPNHIGIFPIPIAYQELGGNARALLLTSEMQFLEETIINSLGVPIEFIKGGASWTGSAISLRIIENHFLVYRELLSDFLNHFLVDKLHNTLGYPEVKLKFKKFKMSDDAQAKQLLLNLRQMDEVSASKVLDEFGYDYDEEKKAIKQEQHEKLEQLIREQRHKAEAQAQAEVILQKGQVEAQYKAQIEQLRLRIETFQEEVEEELDGLPMEPLKMIEHYALKVAYLEPEEQQQFLFKLEKTKPVTYSLVVERLQQIANAQQNGQQQGEAKLKQTEPPNQQPVGSRAKDRVDTTSEKTKGNTRGEPRT